MKTVKKILHTILYIVIIICLFLLYFYFYDGKQGKGDYFIYYAGPNALKSTSNQDLYLADIIMSDYDDNYIILCRVPLKRYTCRTHNYQKFIQKLQFMIVLKQDNKIYTTYNYQKFIQKLKELPTKLYFSEQDRIKAKKIFQKNKHLYINDKLLENNCREDIIPGNIEELK